MTYEQAMITMPSFPVTLVSMIRPDAACMHASGKAFDHGHSCEGDATSAAVLDS